MCEDKQNISINDFTQSQSICLLRCKCHTELGNKNKIWKILFCNFAKQLIEFCDKFLF